MNTRFQQKWVLPLVLVAVLGISLTAVNFSWAQPGMGPRGAGLTPEQAQKIYDLRQKFLKETEDLRQQMFTKRAELNSLWVAENPDQKAILAKQQEINVIREKIQAIAVTYQTQARKIAPNAAFGWGKGMGKGMGGGPWSMW